MKIILNFIYQKKLKREYNMGSLYYFNYNCIKIKYVEVYAQIHDKIT